MYIVFVFFDWTRAYLHTAQLIIFHLAIQEMIRLDTDFIHQNMTISQKGADKMHRKK